MTDGQRAGLAVALVFALFLVAVFCGINSDTGWL